MCVFHSSTYNNLPDSRATESYASHSPPPSSSALSSSSAASQSTPPRPCASSPPLAHPPVPRRSGRGHLQDILRRLLGDVGRGGFFFLFSCGVPWRVGSCVALLVFCVGSFSGRGVRLRTVLLDCFPAPQRAAPVCSLHGMGALASGAARWRPCLHGRRVFLRPPGASVPPCIAPLFLRAGAPFPSPSLFFSSNSSSSHLVLSPFSPFSFPLRLLHLTH
jgi:hypothetical protein